MQGRIRINNNILTIFPFKYKKEIYWITTPHSCKISSKKTYQVLFDNEKYQARLYKQAYYCDLAVFKIDNFKQNLNMVKIIKSKNNLLNKKLFFKGTSGFFIKYHFTPYLDMDGASRQMYYLCNFNASIVPGDSGSPVFNQENKLVGMISIAKNKDIFLVPGFFIPKVIDSTKNKIIPYLPLKLTIEDEKIIILNNYKSLKKMDVITAINNIKITNDSIYMNDIKEWIPIDTYILNFVDDFITITVNNETKIRLEIEDMNNYLRFPFDPNPSKKKSYQHKMEKKAFQDIKRNLVL